MAIANFVNIALFMTVACILRRAGLSNQLIYQPLLLYNCVMHRNTEKRFWQQVNQTGECWPYLQALDKDGYGQFYYQKKNWRAHRLAWYFCNGPIPVGQQVLHRCDNPRCCRPEHLWLGTVRDNVRDMMNKGRNRNHVTGRLPERVGVKR